MTEIKKKALDVLDDLLSDGSVTDEEYSALAAGLQEGSPLGDSTMRYTAILIDGGFMDTDEPSTDSLLIRDIDCLELGALLRIAMRQDFDMVVRRAEESEE